MENKELAFLNRIWGPGKAFDEEGLETLAGQILEQGPQRGFVSLLPDASNRLRAVSVRQHHEEQWAADFGFSDAYITFLDSIIAAFIYDPDEIAVPSNIPFRMHSWYRNVMAFNEFLESGCLNSPLPRPEFWKRGFSKIAREIFTDRVIAHQVDANLKVFVGGILSDTNMRRVYTDHSSVVETISQYLQANWQPDGYFDFSKTNQIVKLLYGSKTILVTKKEVIDAVNKASTDAAKQPYLTRSEIVKRVTKKTYPQNIKHILSNGVRSNLDILMRHLFLAPNGEPESQ